jgi:hypothetical protein
MKNIKIEKNLSGPDWWKSTFAIKVQGDTSAAELPAGLSREEKEKIIQGWKTIAVLEVEPKNVPFFVGFKSNAYLAILKYPLETLDGKFGMRMRIGKEDVEFFAVDKNLEKEIALKLVETTTEDDNKYLELPLY